MLSCRFGQNFAREYKYTVGQKITDEAMCLIQCIYQANKSFDKGPALEKAREHTEMIRVYVRLMHEFNQLSLKQFVEINQNIEDVSKQITAWESYSKKNQKNPPESSALM